MIRGLVLPVEGQEGCGTADWPGRGKEIVDMSGCAALTEELSETLECFIGLVVVFFDFATFWAIQWCSLVRRHRWGEQ